MLTAYRKIFWNKLKNSSAYKALLNNWFLVAFFLLLFIIAYKCIVAVFLFIAYALYLFKKNRMIFYAGLTVTLLFITRFAYEEKKYEPAPVDDAIGFVTDVKSYKHYNRITLASGNKKYYVYDASFKPLDIGDKIEVKGSRGNVEGARIEGGFDYRNYLKQRRVNGVVKAGSVKVVGKRFDPGLIRQKLYRHLDSLFDEPVLSFLQAIILGESGGFADDFQEAIKINGISHLFAISGLHVGLLIIFLNRFFRLIKINQGRSETIILGILFLYALLVNFTPSIVRAVLLYDGYYLNKRLKLGFSSLDLLSLIFVLLVLWNPYYLYHNGFVLSFTVTLIIVTTAPLLYKTKHLIQLLLTSLFSWIITLPIIVNLNNEINFLSPLVNAVYIDFVGYIILPLSFLVLFLPILSWIYFYFVKAFIDFTVFLSDNFALRIGFPDLPFVAIIVYYLFLAAIIKSYARKKYRYFFVSLLLLFLFAASNSLYFKSYPEIVFLDLYNGESTLISDCCNRCNVLIDTGDGKNNEVTAYLKRRGVKKLDYLIITHNHNDHNGEAYNIIREIAVNNIVVSAYDNSELSRVANIKVKKGDKLTCGAFVFHILHPDAFYHDENDNSIVVHVYVGEYYFLFLGDISEKIENKIAAMNLPVDVIKVAHHGSNTATSRELLSRIRPRYAVIQTGRVEKFGFPAERTIATLQRYNVVIYRTDLHYSVKYKYRKKESIFDTIK